MNEKLQFLIQLLKKYAFLDWVAVAVVLATGLTIDFSPYPRDFRANIISDIDQPLRTSTIPYNYLCIITFGIGGVVAAFIWLNHHGLDSSLSKCLAAYYFSICFTILISCFLKKVIARPRPDTLARCGGDGSFYQCTQNLPADLVADQFYSFPSGHAAEIMAPAVFLSFLIAELFRSSQIVFTFFRILPIVLAIFASASRIWDRAHHVDDVVMGMFLGAIVGFLTFHTFTQEIGKDEEKDNSLAYSISSMKYT
ncbi:PAP2 superfamily protein [Tritrichomonas foetus]|uniref:PAP2 superfamily protein n=1 Tax=Tritrichomonas foetus TaxID=1144522 RepID=A0A1J4KN11_9EUKA|nr:PAP2 superfamily protein [Tritrichomonas foetus]|eukprot:OHT11086.1 PAP2 superfamily protein [Tritrichomonas foetus]